MPKGTADDPWIGVLQKQPGTEFLVCFWFFIIISLTVLNQESIETRGRLDIYGSDYMVSPVSI